VKVERKKNIQILATGFSWTLDNFSVVKNDGSYRKEVTALKIGRRHLRRDVELITEDHKTRLPGARMLTRHSSLTTTPNRMKNLATKIHEADGKAFNFKSENLQFADGKLAADEIFFCAPN
jgi:hypothetical protein